MYNKLYVIVLLLALTGCVGVGKMNRVVDPLEAIQLCGEHGVATYTALSGIVKCLEE